MSTASNVPRTRDQRPCDNCRKRKIRCLFGSDDAVNCVLCISRSTECTYLENAPKKRRLSRSEDNNSTNIKTVQRSKSSTDNADVIKDYSTLPGPSLLKETLGHQNRQSISVVGQTADFDPLTLQDLAHNAKGECCIPLGRAVLRRPTPSVYFKMRPDSKEEIDEEIANLDEIESMVAPHGAELVNLYFRIMHPSFPVLHKKVFLEKHGRSYRESTPTGLGAVYLMALNWWSYSPALSGKTKPDGKALQKVVLRMLFDVHRRPKISDLQGGLVLLQHNSINSWAMTGHLVSMAQNLGINLDCSDWQIPDWERGVRKRVAWGIWMQDKWGALVHGRPSNIHNADWEVPLLEELDFPETFVDDDDAEGSAEIEKGKQTFMQMLALTQIVSDILEQFFTLRARRRQDSLTAVLERARPLQLRLKSWYANLPSILSVDDTKPRRLSSVGYLHLAYYTAEVTIHRAILRSHANLDPNVDLFFITRQAASTRFTHALEFVKRLKQEHFQSFWYFSSSISFAVIGVFAGVLAVTSLDDEERKSYMDLLADYRWVLRISSTGASVTKYGVNMLDAYNQILEHHSTSQSANVTEGQGSSLVSPEGNAMISPTSEDWFGSGDNTFNMQALDYGQTLDDFNAFDTSTFFTY